ncbi:hypothetical protein TNCV_614231 [Trichonephila clavipes]|nr:hypothetical protein TNCV_614231 [Trichonephila clavipes]
MEDDLIPFHLQFNPFERDTTSNEGYGEWVSKAVYIMGATIATVLQIDALQWYGLTQRPLVKVMPTFGWRTMR